jgi:hypothetical protein
MKSRGRGKKGQMGGRGKQATDPSRGEKENKDPGDGDWSAAVGSVSGKQERIEGR